ncbi:DNA mismatch repair protein Msh6-like isoform X2 [Pollicipes pollicipes]|nr:DNA mismatch repair protein Msh6-like isoform X2 [Pollicipes pollicipes]
MSQKNTLFNYFQRSKASPTAAGSKQTEHKECTKSSTPISQKEHTQKNTTPKVHKQCNQSVTPKRPRPTGTESGSHEAGRKGSAKQFKRLRLQSDDDDSENDQSLANGKKVEDKQLPETIHSESDELDEDSEDEYQPKKHELSSDDEYADDAVDSAEDSPVKKTPKRAKLVARTPTCGSSADKKSPRVPSTPSTPAPTTPRPLGSATKLKLASFSAECEASPAPADDLADNWPHLKLDFLLPERRRDAAGRRPSDPDFNPRSLRVPADFLDKQTPALRQWWVIKCEHFDCVIFFKMGKFYEMFHMDAVLCVKELGLLYMKGDHAHVGFPEASYGRYAAALVEKGHKVCRVEQTETPDMMQSRVASSTKRTTKFDKVVAREVCQITSRGTRTFSAMEGDATDGELRYLLAVREQEVDGELQFGVCFVDTSVGHFRLGQFSDDCHCSRLRTLLAHYPPVQLLQARTAAPQRSRDVLTSLLPNCLKETLRVGEEFWAADKTLRFLAETDYFREGEDGSGELQWPQTLLDATRDGDTLHLNPRKDCELALQCLGAVTWYLQLSMLDTQLLSMRRFSRYQPPDVPGAAAEDGSPETPPDRPESDGPAHHPAGRMVLDGVTLRNLEIVSNSVDGGTEGTLLGTLDTCVTAFGKRVLRAWLCSPLRSPAAIAARLDAVEDLMSRADVMDDVTARLKQLPDLERLVRRIHVQGNSRLRAGGSHPDSRAIMFEQTKYSRSRVMDLLSALAGFKQAAQLLQSLAGTASDFGSYLLRCCLTLEKDGGKFPEYDEVLEYFETSFDQAEARKEGRILPSDGVDEQFDAARDALEQVERELDEYLHEQCRHFGCKVVYFGQAKNRYQLEVPDRAVHKAGGSYELQTQKKGAKRYWTDTTKELLARQLAAEEQRTAALRDISRRMFARFSRHQAVWERAVQCLGLLDGLLALARFSRGAEVSCRPELVTGADQAVLEITDGHHPWLGRGGGGADFIPNSVGTERGRLLLITGPNMGGKSTLMRQAGLLVILAQLGCYVPAASLRLSPVDRVFTRLGAQDRIMSGESTFHVELSETAAILQHATAASLVLVDELGRGTSTFDGSAIASAVLRQLLRVGCRCLFSTHYHSLVEEFQDHDQVWLGHMACMVENENQDDPTQETITFLYKLTDGACPKSYGFNAARLAGLPADLIRHAHQRARRFEQRVERMIRFTTVWRAAAAAAAQ